MRKSVQKIVFFTDKLVSLIILATIGVVLFFAVFEFWKLSMHFPDIRPENALHTVALSIVFVKAYRMLLYYLECHHISVKYIVEISIIAPAVELIFASSTRPIEINILFAFFSIAMLIIYLVFYKKLNSLENECLYQQ